MKLHRIHFRLCALASFLTASFVDGESVLFISSPTEGQIYTARLLPVSSQARNVPMDKEKLAGAETIKNPKGLAVDSIRKVLFIIDGDDARTLHAARIYIDHKGHVAIEGTQKLAESLSSDWVTVDYAGRVFFIANNQVWMMPQEVIDNRIENGPPKGNSTSYVPTVAKEAVKDETAKVKDETDKTEKEEPITFQMVYDGGSVTGVNMPQGLAADGYRLFWSNGQNGEQDGTVVQGFEDPIGDNKVTALATNLATAHGVCLTTARIFYTDEENKVFSTKVNGGPFTMVTDKLKKPRGCVYDGDGTVFVADWGDNKIVSFAGAAMNLGPRRMMHALGDIKDPFGLAVLQGRRKENSVARSAVMLSMALALLSLSV